MNLLIKNFKSTKPSKVIKVYDKETVGMEIYVRSYPRIKLNGWIKELHGSEKTGDPITAIYRLMAKFCGLCMCDKNGKLVASDDVETVDFLLSIEDNDVLVNVFEQSIKVSGIASIAGPMIALVTDEGTTDPAKKPNRSERRNGKKGK